MTLVVVDASAMASWLLRNQATAASEALFLRWSNFDGLAPSIFPLEIRAILLKAERRGWLSGSQVARTREALDLFALGIAPPLDDVRLDETYELARSSRISFYDALYLELAVRLQAGLVTRDSELIAAAKRLDLTVYDLRPATGFHED